MTAAPPEQRGRLNALCNPAPGSRDRFGKFAAQTPAQIYESLIRRFHEKYVIVEPCGCWIWLGAQSGRGYGYIKFKGRMLQAHRVSWELHHGPIGEADGHHGACVLHRCDTPSCVNPNHLFVGSHADNMEDKVRKGRAVFFGTPFPGPTQISGPPATATPPAS